MKTLHRFSFLLLIAVLLTSSSCIGNLFGGDDDDDVPESERVNDRLQGEWEVTSWRLNGQEVIRRGVSEFIMDFEKDEFDDGEVEWDIDFTDPSTQDQRIDLSYLISEDGEEITIDGDTYEIDFDGNDEFELDGNVQTNNGSQRWQMELERD